MSQPTNKRHAPGACPDPVFTKYITLRNGTVVYADTVFVFCPHGKKNKNK
jgi:hypothetical protein